MIPDVAENTPRRASPDAPAQDDPSAATRGLKSRLRMLRDGYGLVSDILTPQRIGLVLAAIVLVASGSFGGLDEVNTKADAIPVAKAGQIITVKPFTISVTKLIHFKELGSIAPTKAGTTYYMAVMKVTNTSDAVVSAISLAPALKLAAPNVAPRANPLLYRAQDSIPARGYQPGVPVLTAVIWAAETSTPAPTEATLTLSNLTWYQYFSSNAAAWRVDVPAYTLTLPIEEKKAA